MNNGASFIPERPFLEPLSPEEKGQRSARDLRAWRLSVLLFSMFCSVIAPPLASWALLLFAVVMELEHAGSEWLRPKRKVWSKALADRVTRAINQYASDVLPVGPGVVVILGQRACIESQRVNETVTDMHGRQHIVAFDCEHDLEAQGLAVTLRHVTEQRDDSRRRVEELQSELTLERDKLTYYEKSERLLGQFLRLGFTADDFARAFSLIARQKKSEGSPLLAQWHCGQCLEATTFGDTRPSFICSGRCRECDSCEDVSGLSWVDPTHHGFSGTFKTVEECRGSGYHGEGHQGRPRGISHQGKIHCIHCGFEYAEAGASERAGRAGGGHARLFRLSHCQGSG